MCAIVTRNALIKKKNHKNIHKIFTKVYKMFNDENHCYKHFLHKKDCYKNFLYVNDCYNTNEANKFNR